MHKVIKKDLKSLKKKLRKFRSKITVKRFLVTGGAGFIGSWICDTLALFSPEKIVCVDNLSTLSSSISNIAHLMENENFTFIKADVSKTYWLSHEEIKRGFDYILHLAARADPKDYVNFPIETMLPNSFGTFYTLKLAEKFNATYYFASTSEVYGNPKIHPQSESYWGNVNPVGIRSCYDESKRFSEALCMAFMREKGVCVKINRIFNTYGPRLNDGRVICTFISQALKGEPITVFGDGKQTRSPCYITDMVYAMLLTLFEGKSGEVYNAGNPEEIRIIDLARIIKKLTNSSSRIIFLPKPEDDPTKRRPDISKISKELGFFPEVSLKEGLEKTIEWFRGEEK